MFSIGSVPFAQNKFIAMSIKISLKENVSNKLFRSSSALKKMFIKRWRFIFGLVVFCFGNSVSRKSSEKPEKLGQCFMFLVIFTNVVKQTSLVINLSLGGQFGDFSIGNCRSVY